jgi:ABC-type transport system substrate-binding protein
LSCRWLAAALPAQAPDPRNTLVFLREIDADRYDLHRSTARSAGEVVYMMTDTLVSMDFDGRTIRPGLAERWEVSPTAGPTPSTSAATSPSATASR